MTSVDSLAFSVEVKINHAPLAFTVAQNLISAEVESTMSRPDSFRLVFRDVDNTVLDEGGFLLASPVSISVLLGDSGWELMSGEIAGVELQASSTGRFAVVRGLDRSHRLYAGTKTKAWKEVTASDIATEIAGEAELETKIDPTDSTYTVMTQANVSDWTFLQQLALASNRDAFVSKGIFHFVKPLDTSEAPEPAASFDNPHGTQLVFQQNVLRLQGTISGTEQVESVDVRGWDPTHKIAVVGTGTPGTTSVSIQDEPSLIAPLFGQRKFAFTSVPFTEQSEADTMAASLSEHISGAFAELEGECLGNPHLLAGSAASMSEAGDPFDGKYVVTSALHRIDNATGGFRTWFRLGGRSDRSLLSLMGDPRRTGGTYPFPSIPGVVTAVVSSNKDPENKGRVQLAFPWLDDSYVSDWVRTSQIDAGDDHGFLFIPEVNSEVLVGFAHGNPAYPYVIGGLYNGNDKAHEYGGTIDDSTGAVNNRSIRSRSKHSLWFNDTSGQEAITLQTGKSECSIILKAAPDPTTVTIDSKGNVEIKGAQDVTVSADQNLTLKAGASLSIQATGDLKLQAATAQLKSDGPMEVSGAMVKLGGG